MKFPALFFVFSFLILGCSEGTRSTLNADGDHVIYGADTRQDVDQARMDSLAAATAIFIADYRLQSAGTLGASLPLCANEPFQDQKRFGYCSGVLIAPNKVLTAGHCFDDVKECRGSSIAFGFTHDTDLKSAPLYRCKNILQQKLSSRADYAIVELDRAVTSVAPVTLATENELQSAETVISYSYPLGLPLKRDEGDVLDLKPRLGFFRVAVDTFSGSSGSPLFLPNGKLIGILSSGSDDYLEDDEYRIKSQGGCLNFQRCDETQTCLGENYYKTFPLIEIL